MPVNSQHPEYQTWSPIWKQCRDCVAGQRAVKAAGETYLPRLSGQIGAQGDREYAAYLKRSMFYPATGRTVEGLMGAILRKEPSVEMPESLQSQMADVTQGGRSLVGFVIDAVEEVVTVGRYGILVDMPAGQTTAAARPYWVGYAAEQIINWKSQKVVGEDGREIERLTMVVLEETRVVEGESDKFQTKTDVQYRVLELVDQQYTVSIWRKATKDSHEWLMVEEFVPARRGKPFDEIPFVIIGTRDTRPSVDKPTMEDLSNVNLSHYCTSADLEHGAHLTALPTAYATGVEPSVGDIAVGSSTFLKFQNVQSKCEYLEFKGEGLGALEKRADKKELLMATIGVRLLETPPSTQETAAAVRLRHSGTNATLATMVVAMSEGFTQVAQWHVWWAGLDVADDEVSIALNTEFFDVEMAPEMAKALLLEYQSGAISFETYYWIRQRYGLTRPGVTHTQELDAIEAETPEPEPPPVDDPIDPNLDPNADPNADPVAQRRPAA